LIARSIQEGRKGMPEHSAILGLRMGIDINELFTLLGNSRNDLNVDLPFSVFCFKTPTESAHLVFPTEF